MFGELGAHICEIVGGQKIVLEHLGAALVDPGDLSSLGNDIDEARIIGTIEVRIGEQRSFAGMSPANSNLSGCANGLVVKYSFAIPKM